MATFSLRLWTTTMTFFLLCCMLSSAQRYKACDKNAARLILTHCFRWKRNIATPHKQITQGKQKDYQELMVSYLARPDMKNPKIDRFSEILPRLAKRKTSALNMIAHVCCKVGCLISDICP